MFAGGLSCWADLSAGRSVAQKLVQEVPVVKLVDAPVTMQNTDSSDLTSGQKRQSEQEIHVQVIAVVLPVRLGYCVPSMNAGLLHGSRGDNAPCSPTSLPPAMRIALSGLSFGIRIESCSCRGTE